MAGTRAHLGSVSTFLTWAAISLGLLLPCFAYDLWLPDEPRVAHTSLEMVRTGDLVLPTVNGEPFLQVPPLHHWVLAGWFAAAGTRPDGLARIPSVAFSLATLLLTARLARRYFGPRAALLAAGILASTFGFWDAGHRTVVDPALAFFTTLAFHHLAAVLVDADLSARRALLLGAAAGLAFLAKGWIGPIFLGLAALPGLLMRRELLRPRLLVVLACGAFAFLAVALPWATALWSRDAGHLEEILFGHARRRFLEGFTHDPGNLKFLHRALLHALPAVVVLPLALLRGSRLNPLLLGWILLPFLFLLVSRSKRDLYLLPLYPALAIAAAGWVDGAAGRLRLGGSGRELGQDAWSAPVILLVLAVAVGGTLYHLNGNPERSFAAVGRHLADLERDGAAVIGHRLHEREVAAIAWYLGHPFPVIADPALLLERLGGAAGGSLPPRAVLVAEAEEVKALGLLPAGAVLQGFTVAGEKQLSRRRIQVLSAAPTW